MPRQKKALASDLSHPLTYPSGSPEIASRCDRKGPLNRFKLEVLDLPCKAKKAATKKVSKIAPLAEWREQALLVEWCSCQWQLKGHVIAIANGGEKTASQAYVARRMGLRKGASDLFIARPAQGYHGLWLEVKRDRTYSESEKRTDTWLAQEEFMLLMRKVGYMAERAFGYRHGMEIVWKYLTG